MGKKRRKKIKGFLRRFFLGILEDAVEEAFELGGIAGHKAIRDLDLDVTQKNHLHESLNIALVSAAKEAKGLL